MNTDIKIIFAKMADFNIRENSKVFNKIFPYDPKKAISPFSALMKNVNFNIK